MNPLLPTSNSSPSAEDLTFGQVGLLATGAVEFDTAM